MEVIAEAPWNWFLFYDEGKLYLDVLVENGAASFSVAAELNREQADAYRREGNDGLTLVAGEMRHKALLRTWRLGTLPSDWGPRSVAAVHEWQRRAKA
ncbi:MAG TPA: hypothetical protein VN201_04785 [Roseateles sp.]|nr:hypothetical protein [Roseateles sp.]